MSKTGWDMTDEELDNTVKRCYEGWHAYGNERDNIREFASAIRALFPRPEPRQDVPSVPDIRTAMFGDGKIKGSGLIVEATTSELLSHCARVAHAMMQKLAVRPRMMIDGMTVNEIHKEINYPSHSQVAVKIHALANTPAEPAPDPDAEAKELSFKWHQSTKHGERFSHADLYWSYIGNRMGAQDAWRAVATAKEEG
jgi:hypothetical protein